MRTPSPFTSTFTALAVMCVLMTTGLTAAHAEAEQSSASPASIAETTLDAAPAIPAVQGTATADGSLEVAVRGTDVTIPAEASSSITFEVPGGGTVGVGVPGAVEGTPVGGAMVYEDAAPATDIVVQPTAAGPMTLIKIDSSAAPTAFPFPVTVPAGGMVTLTDEGGAVVLDAEGQPVLGVPAPWAKAADGASVPTRFEIVDGNLVQHVEHRAEGVVHPVVADPWLQWVKGRAKWVFRGMLVNRAVVWWYERNGYTCDWWASAFTAPVACYQTVR